MNSDIFGQICGHLPTFKNPLWPHFERKKPVFMRGFGLQAHFAHFFSLINNGKSLKIYINKAKKPGKVGKDIFRRFMGRKLYYKDIYADFKRAFPRLSQKAVCWQPSGYCSISIRFDDGAMMVYDYISKRGNYMAVS